MVCWRRGRLGLVGILAAGMSVLPGPATTGSLAQSPVPAAGIGHLRILAPVQGARVLANTTKQVVRVGVNVAYKWDVQPSDLTIEVLDAALKVTKLIPLRTREYVDDGWEWEFAADLDASVVPQGRYTLKVNLLRNGAAIDIAANSFSVGVSQELVDAVCQRVAASDALALFGQDALNHAGGSACRDTSPAETAPQLVTMSELEGVLDQVSTKFADPVSGVPFPGTLLAQSVLGHAWLTAGAAFADQEADLRRVLDALTVLVARPHPQGQYGLVKRAKQTVTPDLLKCLRSGLMAADECRAQYYTSLVGLATSVYSSAQGVDPVSTYGNLRAGFSFSEPSTNEVEGAMSRSYSLFHLPQAGAAGPLFPLDVQEVRLRATVGLGEVAATISVRSVTRDWKLDATEWAKDAQAVGTALAPSEGGKSSVVTSLDLAPLVLRQNPAPNAANFGSEAMVVQVRGDEGAPRCALRGTPAVNYTCATQTVTPQLELLLRVRFATPFVSISPNSLDASIQGLPNHSAAGSGALDFANQVVATRSEPHKIAITNGGTGALLLSRLLIRGTDADHGATPFTLLAESPGACPTAPLAIGPGDACTISVVFTPTRQDVTSADLAIYSNAGFGPRFVNLTGTGTTNPDTRPVHVEACRAGHDSIDCGTAYLQVEPTDSHPCSAARLLGLGIGPDVVESGWRLVGSKSPATLDGQVVESHVVVDDAFFNHYTQDFNMFIYPDARSRGLLAWPGNFAEGDAFERGLLEVEWERRSRGTELAEAAAGLPEWAWPAPGDRVHLVGNHIFDCGHHDIGYRAELHPPRLAVTYRNSALSAFAGAQERRGSWYADGESGNLTRANRVDVFASSYGGKAVEVEFRRTGSRSAAYQGVDTGQPDWWQPVNDQNYEFVIKAPPKPSPTARLARWQCSRVRGSSNCDAILKQGLDRPVPGSTGPGLEFAELPTGDGYSVTIPFEGWPDPDNHLMVVGNSVWVGWTDTARATPVLTRTFQVSVREIRVFNDIASDDASRWLFWGYVNDQGANLFDRPAPNITNEDCQRDAANRLGEAEVKLHRFMMKTGGEGLDADTSYWSIPSADLCRSTFRTTVLDDQPLHVEFRAAKDSFPFNAEAGTADRLFLPDQAVSDQGRWQVKARYDAAGEYWMPADPKCRETTTGCFDVLVHVEQLAP